MLNGMLRAGCRVLKLTQPVSRCLSSSETAAALRPFYFAVHPDLFGQHPQERVVNEESLKKLNQYLEKLKTQHKVPAVQLVFYLRDDPSPHVSSSHHRQHDNLRSVSMWLLSQTVRETVQTVLTSCDLKLDYINSLHRTTAQPRRAEKPPDITWHHTFYSLYGIPNPDSVSSKPPTSLNAWLQKNVAKARQKQRRQEPVGRDVQRLLLQLREETGVADIRWDSGWGATQFRACLRGLLRLCRQHQQLQLKGRVITFGSGTGVCIHGNTILCSDEVSESWLPMLQSIGQRSLILHQLPAEERFLSSLLGGVQVLRWVRRPVLARDYLGHVKRLNAALRDYRDQHPTDVLDGSLEDLQLVVDCTEGSLSLSPSGQILVPSSSPAFLVVDFLERNVDMARHLQDKDQTETVEAAALLEECKTRLELLSLEADDIKPQQVRTFCTSLLSDCGDIRVSLQGARLKVALFYSVMSNGEICIPWDYKRR